MSILSDLFVRIKGDKTQLDSTLKGAEGSVKGFGAAIAKLGGLIAGVFSVAVITGWIKEGIKAAVAAEGILTAFKKIASPEIMGELKKSTRGMFDDAQLAEFAVKARNLGIPLKELPKYLEFATARAITTGKSIDDLSEAIITGVGRKSSRALLQLGISVGALQSEIKKTGSFTIALGNLMDQGFKDMGTITDTTAVKVRQLSTVWNEFLETIGKKIIDLKFVQDIIGGMVIMSDKLNTEKKSKFAGMSDEELKKAKEYLEINKNTLLDELGTIQGKKNALTIWDKLNGNAKAVNKMMTGTEWEVNQILTDIQEINALLNTSTQPGTILDPDALAKSKKELEDIKKLAGPAFFAKTSQLNELPQTKTGTSVFNPTRSGIAPELSNQLAGAPAEGNQGIANIKAAQIDADMAMAEAEARLDKFKSDLNNALTELQYMAVDFGANFADAIGQALAGGNTQDLGKGLLLMLADFMSQFGKMLLTVGLGIAAFEASIASMNPALAIAAGIALMVAAGAVRGLMSKGLSGGGSSGGGSSSGGGASFNPQTIHVEGVIKGKDLYIMSRRYAEDNG